MNFLVFKWKHTHSWMLDLKQAQQLTAHGYSASQPQKKPFNKKVYSNIQRVQTIPVYQHKPT